MSLLFLHVILSIILTVISITCFIIIYQLCVNLYCTKTTISDVNDSPEQVQSTSNIPSLSISKSNSNDIANSNNQSNPTIARNSTKTKTVHPFFRRTTITSSVLFCFVCFSVNIDRFMLVIQNGQRQSFKMAIPIWSFYFIGRMVLSLIFIGRLILTFKDLPLAHSKFIVYVLKFLWILLPIFAILGMGVFYINAIFGAIFGALFIFDDIILSIILLYLFLKKLFDLMGANPDKRLVSLMTRYSLLYSLYFVSTVIVFVLLTIAQSLVSIIGTEAQAYVWIFVAIDCLVNIVCVWLNLSFAERWYYKLCQYFHIKCELICSKCTKSSTDQNMVISDIQENAQQQKHQLDINIIPMEVQSSLSGNSAIIL
eukprot:185758_1